MSEEKFVVEILQVDKCTYRIVVDKLIITISTVDQSEQACIDAFALVHGLSATLEAMNRARELARQTLSQSSKEDVEGVM